MNDYFNPVGTGSNRDIHLESLVTQPARLYSRSERVIVELKLIKENILQGAAAGVKLAAVTAGVVTVAGAVAGLAEKLLGEEVAASLKRGMLIGAEAVGEAVGGAVGVDVKTGGGFMVNYKAELPGGGEGIKIISLNNEAILVGAAAVLGAVVVGGAVVGAVRGIIQRHW